MNDHDHAPAADTRVRAAILRPLVHDPQDGEQIIAYLVASVSESPRG